MRKKRPGKRQRASNNGKVVNGADDAEASSKGVKVPRKKSTTNSIIQKTLARKIARSQPSNLEQSDGPTRPKKRMSSEDWERARKERKWKKQKLAKGEQWIPSRTHQNTEDEPLTKGKGVHTGQATTAMKATAKKRLPSAEIEEGPPTKRAKREEVEQPPTMFIRDVPIDATYIDLKDFFSEKFGRVKAVYLVKDKITEKPTGTGFVHFFDEEGLNSALAEANRNYDVEKQSLTANKVRGVNVNPYINYMDRRLVCLPSLDRGQVHTVVTQRKSDEDSSNGRNLHLLKEGKVVQGTPAAEGLSAAYLKMLERRYKERVDKTKNINFHVSDTRLCVSQCPPELDEATLRKLFLQPIKRPKMTMKEKKGHSKEVKIIRQVKVVRDPNRGNKSRGFAFVEFVEPSNALTALRHVNNNPSLLPGGKRLVVEFAIDNVQALRKLKGIQQKGMLNNQRRQHKQEDFMDFEKD